MTKRSSNPERDECVRWSSGSCGRKAAGTASLLLSVLAVAVALMRPAVAQELDAVDLAPDSANLSVFRAIEVQYSAGVGQVFELQGSNDLRGWRDIGDVVFGDGQRVQQAVTSGEPPAAYRYYRVQISNSQAFGFAPKNLVGRYLTLNDEGTPVQIHFQSRSSATVDGEAVSYVYRKLDDTHSRLRIEPVGAEHVRIDLDFSADLIGNYTRTETRSGDVADVDAGTFSLATNVYPLQDPSATAIPESLVGRAFIFGDELGGERLDFVTADSGRAVDGSEVAHFTYDYDSGTVSVQYPRDVTVEYEMTFGVGGRCGTFTRREYLDGTLDTTDEGIFSCAAAVYHTPGADSTHVTLPVDELRGRTYLMRDGGTPRRLSFIDHTSGRSTEGQQVDPFEFNYVVKCNATSMITVRFAEGDYDEYHMNHTDKTFTRHEIRGGERVDSDTGTFTD